MSKKATSSDALRDRIRAITEGEIIPPTPDDDSVPIVLSAFVDDEEYMKSIELFWLHVNMDRFRRYLQETRANVNSNEGFDDYEIHRAIRDHLDNVQPYLFETSRQMGMDPDRMDSDEHKRLQLAVTNMAYIRGELSPRLLKPFVLELEKGARPSTNYKGDGVRKKPQMTLAVCVPILHMINGIFTREFRPEELDYIIHQLTGYGFDSVRQFRPDIKPIVAKKAIPALEKMLESLKQYANE